MADSNLAIQIAPIWAKTLLPSISARGRTVIKSNSYGLWLHADKVEGSSLLDALHRDANARSQVPTPRGLGARRPDPRHPVRSRSVPSVGHPTCPAPTSTFFFLEAGHLAGVSTTFSFGNRDSLRMRPVPWHTAHSSVLSRS